ncbi:uncharacterized protein LOC134317928 [Trichomycterus rosablanca]|uniref:uncharacterized protein LOC134317928 n=1 Tax=Trichomycterus rosablanca TaxID=2290929 RepID=UPI002F35F4C1
MVTPSGDEQLDEAHCLWALCQHPCCWETEHRIAEGNYRRIVKVSSKCPTSVVEESLPSLTVVNVSEWAGKTKLSKEKPLYKAVNSESGASLHRTSCLPVPQQKDISPRIKITNPSFPPISSSVSSFKYNGINKKVAKLHKAQISPPIGSKSPWGLGSVVLWIPNPNCIPEPCAPKSSESSQYSVKDLTCLPAFPIQTTVKCKTQGRKNKMWFKHTCSSRTVHSRGQKESKGSVSPSRSTAPSIEPDRANEERVATMGEPELQTESSLFLLTKKHIILHNIQERGGRRVNKDTATPAFKLDSRTGGESIDWDSLRRQVYLWRKHHVSHHKEFRDRHSPPRGASVPQENAAPCSAHKMSPTKTPCSILCSGVRSVVPVAYTSIEKSNPSPNSNLASTIISGAVKPWTGSSTTQCLCISSTSLR